MRLNSQEILEQQYAADEIAAHSNEIAKFTATNMVDGTAGQSQYLDGLHNKAYGMGVMGLPASHITIAEDTKMANDMAAGYARQIGMDVDTFTYNIASSGVPSWFTTIWTNKMIKQLLQTRPFFAMTHEFQQGMFGTTNIKIPTVAFTGNAVPYADHSGRGSTGINVDWVDRETVTLEQVITYGEDPIFHYCYQP